MGTCSEVYLEKAFKNLAIQPKTRLSNAKLLGETSLMFLVHPTLTHKQINLTSNVLEHVMNQACR
jgi:dTDP-4-amino-4,6-dideoxygalactose transaminase